MTDITKPCPECGQPMVQRTNRQNGSEFLGCSNYPNCTYTEGIPEFLKLKASGAAVLPGFE